MFMTGIWQLQIGVVRALRTGFQHVHQYRWSPDPGQTKIFIYDEFPLVGMRYPSVIVDVAGMPALKGLRGIGEEFAEQVTTPISINGATRSLVNTEIQSGNLKPTAKIRVSARNSFDRGMITDWIILLIRSFANNQFQDEGLFVEDIQVGATSDRLVGNDPVYEISISVTCLTAFTRQIPISVMQTVDALCLVGVFTSFPDGTTDGGS